MTDLAIAREAYETVNAFTQQHWPAHNRDHGVLWEAESYGLLAREGDEIVGGATIQVVGGAAFLEQLVVAYGRKGNGIGSALLRAFEDLAVELGCHVMELETAEYQARGFYEKHGFHVAGVKRASRFRVNWYLMQKHLDES